jgi:hypothetical protein
MVLFMHNNHGILVNECIQFIFTVCAVLGFQFGWEAFITQSEKVIDKNFKKPFVKYSTAVEVN